VIEVQQTVYSYNIFYWLPNILLHFALLLIEIALEQGVESFNFCVQNTQSCITFCSAVINVSGTANSG